MVSNDTNNTNRLQLGQLLLKSKAISDDQLAQAQRAA